jgi:hypothetical protein
MKPAEAANRGMMTLLKRAIEFYHTDPESEPVVTKWKTMIALPVK